MSNKGKITASQIADNNVFEIGKKLADSLKIANKAIEKVNSKLENNRKVLIKNTLAFAKLAEETEKIGSEKDFLTVLEKTNKLTKQNNKTKTEYIKLENEKKQAIERALKVESQYAEVKKRLIALENKFKKAKKDTITGTEQEISLRKEQDKLEKNLIATKSKLELSHKSTNRALIKERTLLNETNKVIREQEKEKLGLIGAYQKLNRQRTEAQKKLANLLATNQKDIQNQKAHQKEIAKTKIQYEKLNKRVLAVDRATNNYTKNIGNYKSALGGLTGSFKSLVGAFGFAGGIYTFVNVLKNGVDIVRNFGATMSNVAGIYRTSRENLEPLENKIIAVAGASVKTATEVAQLAESLATLGKSPDEVEKLLEPVNNLSIGLKASSDEAGEFLVQTMNAFGASSDEAEQYADILATVRTSTSLDFRKMADSFQYLSPISKALGKDVAHTGALIGLLADNGIKAERAGRLMGTAQQKLAKEGKTLNSALQELNKAKEEGASRLDLMALSSKLFGTQANALGLILAENTGKVEENAKAIRSNGGALNDLVNEQLQSLDAHFKILNSRWEEYILNADKSTGASNQLKTVLKYLSDNLGDIINFVINTVKTWAVYKATIIAVSGISRAYIGITTTLRIAKIALAGGIGKATKSMKAFNLATKGNPIGFLIGLLTAAVTAFMAFRDGASLAEKAQRDFNKASDKRKEEEDKKTTIINERIRKEIEAIDGRTRAELVGVKDQVKANKIREKATAEKITMLEREKAEVDKLKDSYKKALDAEIKNESKRLGRKVKKVTTKRGGELTTSYNEKNDLSNAIAKRINYLKTSQKEEVQAIKNANKAKDKLSEEQRKKLLADAHALAQFQIQLEIDKNKTIAESELYSFNQRLQALEISYDKRKELLQKQAEYELSQSGLSASKRKLIQAKLNADLAKLEEEKWTISDEKNKEIINNEKEDYNTRLKAVTDYQNNQEKLIKKELTYKLLSQNSINAEEIKLLLENGDEKKAIIQTLTEEELHIYKDFQNKKTALENSSNEQAGQLYIQRIQKIVAEEEASERQLQEAISKLKKDFRNGEIASIESYEEQVKKLKFNSEKEKLKSTLNRLQQELEAETITAEQKAVVNEEIAKITEKINNLDFDKYVENFQKLQEIKDEFINTTSSAIADAFGIDSAVLSNFFNTISKGWDENTNKAERFAEIAQASIGMVGEIGNAIFSQNIENIEEEMTANEDYYNRQMELAGEDQLQKELLEKEKNLKQAELEKKKRKEQTKQAKFNKAVALTQAGINTALAITSALSTQPFLPLGPTMAVLAGVMGAVQIAAIAAKPIPKYAKGTDYHKGGIALVGEERPEVIIEPNKSPYIISNPALLDLPTGTEVLPSVEEYKKIFKYEPKLMVTPEQMNEMSKLQVNLNQNTDTKELIKEMQLTRKAIQNQKPPIVVNEKIDLDHEMWKLNYVNFN